MTLLQGRYELGDLLGRGGMADVYRGTDTQTGAPVAIKMLKADLATGAAVHLERFRREGVLLRQLDHPNIVKMLDAFQHEDQHVIVMELVSGGSLRDQLRATPRLPLDRVLWIALDLADALTRAHRLDIIHRDLKPANVLIAEDGTPRLTDFGIALLARQDRMTGTGRVTGTPRYLSPEAIDGQRIDERSDIWSFGVVLFEMLAGRVPFEADLLTHVFYAILHNPVPDLEALRPDAPVGLVDLVYRMLEKDPRARIPSVRIVGTELEALLRAEDLVQTVLGDEVDRHTMDGESVFVTPTPPSDAPLHNLPVQTTEFVGREDELAEIARLLADPNTRLLTILGPGGMGKTRLALEAAEPQAAVFERGAWFVPLAPLSDQAQIVTAIAEAVGFQFYQGGGSPREQLINYLRAKAFLLVLDNFEHLLDGADLVTDILRTAPGVKMLATSRERLNLSGETVFALGGMDFPEWESPGDVAAAECRDDYTAVKLFMSSARRVRPGFELHADDLWCVARICRLVAGMPLGIVLAAAWVDMLSPHEIADEVQHSLDFLDTDLQDIPERHRSMRALFESTWARLGEPERDTFMKLSVFRGGFTRQAAQAVTGVALRGLTALANKSLVRRDPDTGRYGVHELLRQYGAEQLEQSGGAHAVRDAHGAYYLEALAHRQADLDSPRVIEVLDEIESDFDNVLAAWYWALEHGDVYSLAAARRSFVFAAQVRWREEGELAVRAAVAALETDEPRGARARLLGFLLDDLCWFLFYAPSAGEAPALAERSCAILQPLVEGVEVASLLRTQSLIAELLGNIDEAVRLTTQAEAIYRSHGHQRGLWFTLRGMSWITGVFQGNYAVANQYAQEALELARQLGSPLHIAASLRTLAVMSGGRGDRAQARQYNEEALAHFRAAGNRTGEWQILNNMGWFAYLEGHYDEARQLLERCLAITDELGSTPPFPHINMSFVLQAWGDYRGARSHLHTTLTILSTSNQMDTVLEALVSYASLLARQHDPERAVETLSVVLTRSSGTHDDARKLAETLRDDLQAQLSPDVFAAAWARGEALDLDATVRQLIDELGDQT